MRVNVTTNLSGLTKLTKDQKKKKILLKQQILKDTNQNVPLGSNYLRNSALKSAADTSDYLIWDAPYAHFQWFGKVMIGIKSHRFWARKYEQKVYTNRDIKYRKGGHKDWFEYTKARKLKSWIEFVRKLYTG